MLADIGAENCGRNLGIFRRCYALSISGASREGAKSRQEMRFSSRESNEWNCVAVWPVQCEPLSSGYTKVPSWGKDLPLGPGCGTAFFENLTVNKVTFEVKMIV